ncbi:AraC family transcriptional regulator [Pseudomonas fluorescens]|uniref:HTH-type transcriptional activator RhaS n=1 Tax=Pseudomonas fluorescens TaxID=294 RepID=A0A5E7N7E3_PSEFL|nr:helix-turn-helix domain-containing protein [Pseudomonas fluorescens]VVP32789.1 HTH-type transcriptional activator RhaS [Pseudomonas fluorescens]
MSIPDEVFRVTSTPADNLNRTIGRWEMNLVPSEREASIRQHKLIQTPKLQCSRLEFDSAITIISAVPHGYVTFAISQASVGRPIINNHELRPNEIIVLTSDEPVHYTCEPNETLLTLTTTLEHYKQCQESHSTIDLLANRKDYRFQVANFKSMQSAIQAINTHFNNANNLPLEQRGCTEASAIESALLTSLLRVLTPAGRASLKVPTRRKVAMAAIEYIHGNLKKALSMKALVKQLQTTTRTLHHGFVETFGISPIAYVRNLRLANVRRDLVRNTWPTVTETAMYWNFQHLSRFSKAYQDAYGVTPSETTRRNAAKLSAPN